MEYVVKTNIISFIKYKKSSMHVQSIEIKKAISNVELMNKMYSNKSKQHFNFSF